MSALTSGPDTVTCVPRVIVGQDRTGSNILGAGEPVTYYRVSVQDAGLSSYTKPEDNNVIQADYLIYKPLEPAWVGGPHSTVIWEGVEYDQVGIVKRFRRGRRTNHEVVKIKARGTEVR